jgi:hypothetical protein
VFDVLEEADAEARAFDAEAQGLWAAAKERLRGDGEPSFLLPDEGRISSEPPVSSLLKYGETTAIRVDYLYVPESKALTILHVQSFPRHDEKQVPYPRKQNYVSP